jgi:hypothetical protein
VWVSIRPPSGTRGALDREARPSYYCRAYDVRLVGGPRRALGTGETQVSRQSGSVVPRSSVRGRTHVRASVGVAVAVGLALSGSSAATAADGSTSPKPKPQVLWQAYPLNPTPAQGTGEAHGVKGGPVSPQPASAPAQGRDAAPRANGTFTIGRLAAAGALAAAIVGLLVLRRRRRRATGRSSAAVAERPLAEPSMESSDPLPPPRVVRAVRVERRPTPEEDRPRPSAEEKAALKRTSETADAALAAKLKSTTHASTPLQDARQRDLTALKAKLGDPQTTPRPSPAHSKREHSGNGTTGPEEHAVVRSISDTTGDEKSRPTPKAPARCRIEWRPDGDEYLFSAVARSSTGDESVLLRSPSFEWKRDTPPSKDFPQVGSAYRALVSRLAAEGWMATGIHGQWYELELERTAEPVRATNRQEG